MSIAALVAGGLIEQPAQAVERMKSQMAGKALPDHCSVH